MRFLSIIIILFTGFVSAVSAQDSFAFDQNDIAVKGMGLGVYSGIERGAGEIAPQEPQESYIGVPQSLLLGIVIKYKYKFMYFRAGFEGGLPFNGGRGNFENGTASEQYIVSGLHVPVTIAMNMPIGVGKSLHMGFGLSSFNGDLKINGDDASYKYSYSATGYHFLIGAETAISESSAFTFEWMHTSGKSGALKNENETLREIGFSGNKFLIGYSYYFGF